MKNMIVFFFFLSTTFVLLSCGNGIVNESFNETRELTPLEKVVVERSNLFAFDIVKEINKHSINQNLFISPLSLYMALGMTYNGADGTTKEAMAQTLHIEGMSDIDFNKSAKSLIQLLTSLDPGLVMKIANSIWIRQGFFVESNFTTTNKNYFNATVSDIDLNDPNAVNILNDWVSINTEGYIPKLIDFISKDVVMYLINAVYFDGKWTYTFDKNLTYTTDFRLPDGSLKPSQMMKQQNEYNFYSGALFTAVDIPYGNENFCFTLILPNENMDVESLIAALNPDDWDKISNEFHKETVNISIPKFKFQHDVEKLDAVLKQLGMGICYNNGVADFTRINKEGGLSISEVKHKTYIEVDEEGSKAAAATSVAIVKTSLPNPIICNRPFIFLIRENNSQSILFIGKVTDPIFE